MKEDIHARLQPDLLADVRSELQASGKTLTAAIEDGLRLWLKWMRRQPKAKSE